MCCECLSSSVYQCTRSLRLSVLFFIPSQRFPCFAFSCAFNRPPWISCNSPCFLVPKQAAKLPLSGAFSQSVEMLLPNYCQFGSNKLIKILYMFEHSLYQHTSHNNSYIYSLGYSIWSNCYNYQTCIRQLLTFL